MADFSSIRNYKLKLVFIIHFLLISLSTMGSWESNAYLFYNVLLIICLLWGIHSHDTEEPVQIAFVVNAFSIILDIFVLAIRFPSSYYASERFSVAMAIIHLIVRPVTVFIMGKIIQERTGTTGPIESIGDLFPAGRRSYEDIDKNVPQPHPSHGSYDFSSAQQI